LDTKDNWQSLIENEVWVCENFLPNTMVDDILEKMSNSDEKTLDGADAKHLVGNTYYNYNVLNDLRHIEEYRTFIIDKLNTLYEPVFGKTAQTEDLSPLNYFFKTFNPKVSKYDLHTESPELFGDAVFMLYLSDEPDGALRIPSRSQCMDMMTDGFRDMMSKVDVRFAGPKSIMPTRNKCVVMRVGLAHLVEPCSGARPCITGWNFASDEYIKSYSN
jgi:hypothetical protein